MPTTPPLPTFKPRGFLRGTEFLHETFFMQAPDPTIAMTLVSLEDAQAAILADRRSRAPDGWVLVPREFVQRFGTLAHNWSLKAEPPCYYHGLERDAFASAYRECGQALGKLRDLLAAPVATPTGVVDKKSHSMIHNIVCGSQLSDNTEPADDPEMLALAQQALDAMAARTPEEAARGAADWVMGPGGSEGTTWIPPTEPAARAQAEPLRDPRMEPFDRNGPLPGMIAAFETQFGQSWTDKDWREEASTWARAWKAALDVTAVQCVVKRELIERLADEAAIASDHQVATDAIFRLRDAALAHTQQPAAAQAKSEAVAEMVVARLFHEYENSAKEDTVGYLHSWCLMHAASLTLPEGRYPLYAAPQQEAERQPLSEDEIMECWEGCSDNAHAEVSIIGLARAIERRLGITGPATQETKHG